MPKLPGPHELWSFQYGILVLLSVPQPTSIIACPPTQSWGRVTVGAATVYTPDLYAKMELWIIIAMTIGPFSSNSACMIGTDWNSRTFFVGKVRLKGQPSV